MKSVTIEGLNSIHKVEIKITSIPTDDKIIEKINCYEDEPKAVYLKN
jgi:hypothetical protein